MVQFLSDRLLQAQSKLNELQIMTTDYAFKNLYKVIVRILWKMPFLENKLIQKR